VDLTFGHEGDGDGDGDGDWDPCRSASKAAEVGLTFGHRRNRDPTFIDLSSGRDLEHGMYFLSLCLFQLAFVNVLVFLKSKIEITS
jgi:hypothetical protein